MRLIAISTALALLASPEGASVAQTLSSTTEFESRLTTPAKDGSPQAVHVQVQSWEIAGRDSATREIPLRGFYVAHLISGHISATTNGTTAEHQPGDYWAVQPGAAMQVKGLDEFARLETTVVTKE